METVENFGLRVFKNRTEPTFNIENWKLQLLYVQLITDKINVADLSSGVFAILISGSQMIKVHKFITLPQISSKTGKQSRNKGSTELYCLFTAADSIVDAISFLRRIVLWSQNKFCYGQILSF